MRTRKTVVITSYRKCSDENILRPLKFDIWNLVDNALSEKGAIMIWQKISLIVGLVALVVALNITASAQSGDATGTSMPGTVEAIRSITVITVHGKIAEVDKAKKEVVLEGPEGKRVTLRVNNPYNLKAAKVGEPVVTRFYEVVTIRKKRPDEIVPSTSLKEGIATAKPGGTPGAVAEQQASVLVSVAAIDEANGTVTIKAPDGTLEKVKARDPKNLKQLKVGDDLVVTLDRAVAISLNKEQAG